MAKGLKGITVEIDGDTRPLNKALTSINASSKGLQRELKAVDKALKFDPSNTTLLTQKQAILKQSIAETENKLKTLNQGMEKIKAQGKDVNDESFRYLQREIEETKQKLQSLSKEEKAFHSLGNKVKNLGEKFPILKNAIKATGDAAQAAAKGGFQLLKGTISATAKGFAAFSTASIGAITALTKAATENYASNEQLTGGIETLFGAGGKSLEEYARSVGKSTKEAQGEYKRLLNAQNTVMDGAKIAYKEAGMSANQYMETVTGFSAALISSVGGDTEKAAVKAKQAVIDMSDNANKMGTSMESIQNAYQGFAKQNFGMLDNLKLGYGGSEKEMKRLLDDASKISGVKYDLSSYADIVDAIHVVQTEMGITGTTAKEAATTIEGSVNMTKSAYQNLLTGLAGGSDNIEELINNLCDSALQAAQNIAPRVITAVEQILVAVPKIVSKLSGLLVSGIQKGTGLIEKIMPQLVNAFFSIIDGIIAILPTMLPVILNAGIQLFKGLLDGLNQTIPKLIALLPQLLTQIKDTLILNMPMIISQGINLIVNLINGIATAIPYLIQTIVELFPVIITQIIQNLPQILEAGVNLILALMQGILQAIPQLILAVPQIIMALVNTLFSMLQPVVQSGITTLGSFISGILQSIPQLVAAIPQIIACMVSVFSAHAGTMIYSGIQLIGSFASGLIQAIPRVASAIPQITRTIFQGFTSTNWGEVGRNIIEGIKNGVSGAAGSLIETFKRICNDALDTVKAFFGIHSPSTIMRDEVGKMLVKGMAIGVEEEMDDDKKRIERAMRKGVPTTIDSYINVEGAKRQNALQKEQIERGGGYTQTINIHSPKEQNPSEIARQTRNQTRQMILRLARG